MNFDERFLQLIDLIGEPYQMLNDDGTYRGCFRVVQVLYPEKPCYNLPSKNPEKNYLYALSKIKKHCIEIKKEELKKGDLITCEFNNELHVAVYFEYGKIIHVFREHEMFISKLEMLNKRLNYWRVI